MRRQLKASLPLLLTLLWVSSGCTGSEQATPTAASTTVTAATESSVTIRTNWDARCDVSWVFRYNDLPWRSPADDEQLDEVRTGFVREASDNSLVFQSADGTVITFELDHPEATACS
jgi:hypothetical protein